jgi:thiamine biosynthesis protein ThiS
VPETVTTRIEISVNGESRSVEAGLTLLDLLARLGIQADRVAVEKDRLIVRKTEWASTPIQAGAQLEIVQFVGGG